MESKRCAAAFRYRNWLFVHNGEIFDIEKLRRDLLFAVAPEIFGNILGSTDSEIKFHLAPLGRTTRVIVSEPVGAFSEMWQEVPQNCSLQVVDERLDVRPFLPSAC